MSHLPSYPPPPLWQSDIPKPPGKPWWIATAVCHLLNASVFTAAVWACVHWINRSQTQEYYCAIHRWLAIPAPARFLNRRGPGDSGRVGGTPYP